MRFAAAASRVAPVVAGVNRIGSVTVDHTGVMPPDSAAEPPTRARSVASWPCQSICVWQQTDEPWFDERAGELAVFSCAGCGSEWVRTEPWTPIDATGQVPAAVAAERAR